MQRTTMNADEIKSNRNRLYWITWKWMALKRISMAAIHTKRPHWMKDVPFI